MRWWMQVGKKDYVRPEIRTDHPIERNRVKPMVAAHSRLPDVFRQMLVARLLSIDLHIDVS